MQADESLHTLDYPEFYEAENLLKYLNSLRKDVYQRGQQALERWQLASCRRAFLPGALNLAHYLAFRSYDLRNIQTALMPWGLSSLGRSESRVLPTLDAVIATLSLICGVAGVEYPTVRGYFRGERFLKHNTSELLGAQQSARRMSIMVTMPSEAAENYQLVRDLLQSGMNLIRINCAHDSTVEWEAMINNLRRAESETGRECKVYMDLGGPKPRTGTVKAPKKTKVQAGDLLFLPRDSQLYPNSKKYPFQLTCTMPEVVSQLEEGRHVWIDDGKLGARISRATPEGFELQVFQADKEGYKLKPEKGMNFPDTDLRLRALTAKDIQDLDFAAHYADIIGYSFVQEVEDIKLLQAELEKRLGKAATKKGIVAKIETPRGVHNLPDLIVAAASKNPFGIMIARGDLAVEIGYQRMAEIQEEILWICEAAHIPVIWATQVLENLVKTGLPSRSEMTDAAMSQRAECVMLNKGPYIVHAVTLLDELLTRMQDHQVKKTPQLRALRMWQRPVSLRKN